MSEQQEAVFPAGLYLGRVPETAPAFVITNQTIHVEKLIEWLTANKNLADEKGYIRLQGKESKNVGTDGKFKRYFQVDSWKPTVTDTATPPDDTIDSSGIPF